MSCPTHDNFYHISWQEKCRRIKNNAFTSEPKHKSYKMYKQCITSILPMMNKSEIK